MPGWSRDGDRGEAGVPARAPPHCGAHAPDDRGAGHRDRGHRSQCAGACADRRPVALHRAPHASAGPQADRPDDRPGRGPRLRPRDHASRAHARRARAEPAASRGRCRAPAGPRTGPHRARDRADRARRLALRSPSRIPLHRAHGARVGARRGGGDRRGRRDHGRDPAQQRRIGRLHRRRARGGRGDGRGAPRLAAVGARRGHLHHALPAGAGPALHDLAARLVHHRPRHPAGVPRPPVDLDQRRLGHLALPRPLQRLPEHHDPPDPDRADRPPARPVRLQGRLPDVVRGLPRAGVPHRAPVHRGRPVGARGRLLHVLPDVLHGHAVPGAAGDRVHLPRGGVPGHDRRRAEHALAPDVARAHVRRRGLLALLDHVRPAGRHGRDLARGEERGRHAHDHACPPVPDDPARAPGAPGHHVAAPGGAHRSGRGLDRAADRHLRPAREDGPQLGAGRALG